ncbi:MAG TPA: DNA polymerase III subunit beta [Candidatus Dormibacteraeota bacterium]|jgi:DNA polymerase-3 subunit beta|nr:DNA polymerase III subunit beta [Candidatus Dormibacteraeota bacterium]
MKLTCSPDALGHALQVVSRAVSPRTTLPILNNVLMETTTEGLRLTGSNLEIGIVDHVDAEVAAEGSVTLPAKLLTEFVAQLPNEQLEMELDTKTQTLSARCGPYHDVKIKGIDAKEFPPLPPQEEGLKVTMEQSELVPAIEQTVVAASADDGRPVLTGVLTQLGSEQLTLAATDGHRLAVRTLPAKTAGAPGGEEDGAGDSVIIPARALAELSRILKGEGTVEMSMGRSRNHVFFSLPRVELMSRLIEGTYPNYSQVIPEQSNTTITVAAKELLERTRGVAIFARDSANVVRIKTEAGEISISANTSEVGSSEASVSAEIDGADIQIAFNSRYLLDVLALVSTEKVTLGFNGPLSPGVVKPAGKEDYTYVIMPVRVAM